MAGKKRVLWWGRFDSGYSRNRVYISLFSKLGWDVDFFFVKLWPRFGDVEAFFRGLQFREKPDLVWVPVARQRDILAACRWAHRRGIPVIFDPMISAWDKKVLDVRIIKEPKNALYKQYQKLFRLDNIELEFEDDAFRAIAHLAIERNTGARGLRSIIESILIKPMYELPSDKTVEKVIVTAKYVKGEEPLTVIRKQETV